MILHFTQKARIPPFPYALRGYSYWFNAFNCTNEISIDTAYCTVDSFVKKENRF